MISEDYVKNRIADWLEHQGYIEIDKRMGTASGIDVQGKNPRTGERVAIECKGETASKNQWDVAWRHVSQGLFNLIKDSEDPENNDRVGLAIPDTPNYRKRMGGLQNFCGRQGISVYWVAEDGSVTVWQ